MMKNRGFSFVEIIIALGLAAIIIPALASALSFSIRITSQGEKFTQAYGLVQEGMEAINYIKDKSPPDTNWKWDKSPLNPVDGTYQPVKQPNGTWVLNTLVTSPVIGPKPFTRIIQVASVYRDSNKNIKPTGTIDPFTRKITSIVTWPESAGIQTASASAYVTKH
jgi:type II secretory pathway pseudopilin PulG